ncbi:type II secretion system GspH family protein [Synechococcus sp. AH-601-N23]|nr:type II secretion system GspH family protein [Synechococcus sp. AH-601-N23]
METYFKKISNGFTLPEVIITTAIVAILGSLALPNYLRQMQKTRQSEAVAAMSQLQTSIVGYVDENGIHPNNWKELNQTSSIMTPTGPTDQNNLGWLTMASSGCTATNKNCYTFKITRDKDSYTLKAKPMNKNSASYNVLACIDLKTGASDLRKGTASKAAQIDELKCVVTNE